MRILILHSRLSSYFTACLKTLQSRPGTKLLIFAWPNQRNAPFDKSLHFGLGQIEDRSNFSCADIYTKAKQFRPQAILVSGWLDKGYLRVCKLFRREGIPVVAGCDTQWTGSLRQRIASVTSPVYLRKAISILWVTGERQRAFAKALGYQGSSCWDGYYACDWKRFAAANIQAPDKRNPYFLYVGRYVAEKGIDDLTNAYRIYRQSVTNPWQLVCAGTGPLEALLCGVGVDNRGFVQPSLLPSLMQRAGAFVLPSLFEPWGVVAQEAAAAGLPLILSDACGAGVHLLRHMYNGYGIPASDVQALARAMHAIHSLSPERYLSFARASHDLSKQYTPERWTDTLIDGLYSHHLSQPDGVEFVTKGHS